MSRRPREMNSTYNGNSQHIGDNIGRNKIENYFFGENMSIRQTKKQYTNKKLVVPFTKEVSNGVQGGTYVQRDDLLRKITDCFEKQIGKKRMVFLSGMGGCGKSELARAFADCHSDEYEEIFWLTCRDEVKPELMPLMADADKLEDVGKNDANGFSDKVLIIVDNCNTDDPPFLFTLEHSTGDADILITTRLGSIGDYQDFLIPVESDDKEAFAYSVFEKNYCKKKRWGSPRKIEESDAFSIGEICRKVQYNTMMVSLIGIRLREYSDLSIATCAKKIREGVGKLDGNVRYSKDLDSRTEEIKDILVFLFSDILKHNFSEAEKAVFTVLSLTPASWYEIDYIVSLCRGTQPKVDYEYAVEKLLNLGWLQGSGDSMAVHPLVTEVITDKQIIAREPKFFEGLINNYLGMPAQYLSRERFLINKILNLGETVQPENRLAVMLLINHGRYKKLFAETFPEVKAAYFVYVVHDERRWFLYRDLEKEETRQLINVPCLVKEGTRAELLKVINKGVPYKLDLSDDFCGKEIEKVPDGLCWNDRFLRMLILSRKIIDIGNNAFFGCNNLYGELRLPDGLTSIGESAFANCSGLTGELRLPDSLTCIGDSAFANCSGLTGELRLPDALTSIGDRAFEGCSGLTGELRLPDALTSIGDRAFEGCSSLTGELHLPDSLTYIGNRAFQGCSSLTGELCLPDSLTYVGDRAFQGCSGLSGKLRLPDALTSIGDCAFAHCSGLTGELRLPDALTSIGYRAFWGCSGLTGELRLPDGLTSIGDSTFLGCSGLSGKLRLPDSLTSIGDCAFEGCSSLTGELRLPVTLTSIGNRAFSYCFGLSGELRLPDALTSIGDCAFERCFGLNGELRLPNSLTSIGDCTFAYCSGLTGELHLPDALTNIGDFAFTYCNSLRGELRLPDSLTSIGNFAFAGCIGLNGELRLPDALTSIGDRAFEGCSGLTGELRLPKGPASIGNSELEGCNGLSGESRLPKGPASIGDRAFEGCIGLSGELRLPDALTSIEDRAFAYHFFLCGELRLPDALTSIGNSAFAYCRGLSGELRLPDSLTSIGDCAFEGCSGLSGELRLPDALTSIGNSAFEGCSGLSGELRLPDSLTSIGNRAFAGCSGLSGELRLPDSLTSIGNRALLECNGIEKIIFYNPFTEIKGPLNLYVSTVIRGYRNSTAEKYASTQELVFEDLEE